jgi:molybdate transport repressor ModE-like protein
MDQIEVRPQWVLKEDGNRHQQRLPMLLQLLSAIYDDENLSKASRAVGLSYRHSWGVIKNGGKIFGTPLVRFTRGQGAKLTVLGEKLVWADRRIKARLSPILESLVSEIGVEIERARADSRPTLRIHASHGYAVAALRDFLIKRRIPVELRFCGNVDALMSLCHSNCELAGFHVPRGDLQPLALKHYAKGLKLRTQTLINVITRRQGLMVAKGNPKGIKALADLSLPGIRFANRQRGSGTRMLLDLLLRQAKLVSSKISGYENVEFTHDAVAAYIASGMADTGLGVEAAARRFNLDFIPVLSERYFLACHSDAIASQSVKEVISVLRSNDFKGFVNDHHGLDSENSGAVMSIDEAFTDLQLSTKY